MIIDTLRKALLDRAKHNDWFTAKGKLTKRGRDGCIDFLIGAALTAEALGAKDAYNQISLQAFLGASGRLEEFLNEKSMPTMEELETLTFPDDHVKGGPCATCIAERDHTFPDGTSSVFCTNFAMQVKKLYPDITKVMGFNCTDNPVDHHEIGACGGHDFAVVADRYIVDHWLRDVVGDAGPVVFDLNDPASEDAIRHRYGDRTKWTEVAA